MSCFPNCFKSSVKPIQNEVFDLMDANGDETVGTQELQVVAKYILEADIERAEIALASLKVRQPDKYVQQLLNTTKIKKKHLKILYPKVQHDIWVNNILPELRKKEIDRLNSIK